MTVSKEWLSTMIEKSSPDGKVALREVYDKHVQRSKGKSGISKAWLTDCIRGESIPERRLAFQMVLEKLTEPLTKSDDKKVKKEIDHNKIYENILLYYIDHGKTPEEAHIIARGVVEDQKQKQKVLDSYGEVLDSYGE